MFYQYILDNTTDDIYTSIKPSHHIVKYYSELKQLNLADIITLETPCKKVFISQEKGFMFEPAVWKIVDIKKLQELAANETVKPVMKFQKGKLISYLNRYNQMPWTNAWIRMKFNKGRCNGEVAWRTTEKEKKDKQDRNCFNDFLFGDNNWLHYDVPSSIPQIVYLLNNKKWFGKRVWDITGESIKSLGQRILFNTTDYSLARSLFQAAKGKKNVSPSKTTYWGEWQNGMWVESEYTEYETFLNQAKYVRERLEAVIGKIPGKTVAERNQLFIHESNIYLMVLNKFLDAGAKVYQVYDSFYWNKDSGVTTEMVAQWCKECGEYYINHYEELMADEEVIFGKSIIQQKLDKKTKEKQKPCSRMKHVRVWVIRNGNKTDYPKKWGKEEIDYARKLQTKK